MYLENASLLKLHINKHHMTERKQVWTSGRTYNNSILEDQTPYRFLKSNEYNPMRNNFGQQFLCLLGCPPTEEKDKMLTGKEIREHYIFNHSFEDLKLWGMNRELLKQEMGLESRYMEDYGSIDVNDTFRGISYNENPLNSHIDANAMEVNQ